ncbi:hypothetical protein BDZ94DRAFT_1251629 [Collybia nuda]|uniref:Uncharacterized protein n=1 Tax=Collybia nuda TaxID=64659 RepID=A0A9P5YCK8_9AGAR|nr:hypothetical protein BDZ94DRAFT_1251629 [Collybia nuda]
MSSSPLASPTPSSLSSSSSFVMLPTDRLESLPRSLSRDRTSSTYDSDDEIVYSVSEASSLSSSDFTESFPASDDDFVVLNRPRSPGTVLETGTSTPSGDDNDRAATPVTTQLVADLKNLAVNDSGSTSSGSPRSNSAPTSPVSSSGVGPKKKRKSKAARAAARAAAKSRPSSTPTTTRVVSPSPAMKQGKDVVKAKQKKSKKKKGPTTTVAVSSPVDFRARSIVDDMSERLSENGDTESTAAPSIYEEAVGFITSFISNPAAQKDSACRLTLLQALIIELGLANSSLPASLTAAKAFLKSRAFLNIREYLAVRGQGPAAVQRIMHPSKNALIKELRKKKNSAPLGLVKSSGLQVLLVPCYR